MSLGLLPFTFGELFFLLPLAFVIALQPTGFTVPAMSPKQPTRQETSEFLTGGFAGNSHRP
jgi:hypothetical protein